MPKSLEDFTQEERDRMAMMYNTMLSNPETREVALRVSKKIDPSLSIPEIELKDQFREALKARDDKNTELEGKLTAAESRERVRAEREVLRGQGFTDADITAIESTIVEEGKTGNVLSYAYAAKVYKQAQERAALEPAPHTRRDGNARKFEMPQNFFQALKGGRAGVGAAARAEASSALDDIRAGRVKLQ